MPITFLAAAGTPTGAATPTGTATSASTITWPLILSTLGGVAVTGTISILLALIQKRGLKQQAEAQERRELTKWQRELRRQSYVDCIVAYEKFRDLLAPLADALGPRMIVPSALTADETLRLDDLIERLHDRYDEAFQRCQVVRLEGPAAVAEAAKEMLLAIGGFRNAAEGRVQAAKAVQQPAERRAWDDSAEHMHTALEDFMSKASAAAQPD